MNLLKVLIVTTLDLSSVQSLSTFTNQQSLLYESIWTVLTLTGTKQKANIMYAKYPPLKKYTVTELELKRVQKIVKFKSGCF